MGWACSTYWERRSVYRVLVGRSEGKRPLGMSSVDERIILKCIFKKTIEGHRLD
jgi:hypothetical protein